MNKTNALICNETLYFFKKYQVNSTFNLTKTLNTNNMKVGEGRLKLARCTARASWGWALVHIACLFS